jgi:hypothetical protein
MGDTKEGKEFRLNWSSLRLKIINIHHYKSWCLPIPRYIKVSLVNKRELNILHSIVSLHLLTEIQIHSIARYWVLFRRFEGGRKVNWRIWLII